MIDASELAEIDDRSMEKDPESGAISWGHFGGMVMLVAGTVGFWLLAFRYAKREKK
jgi:hypothetical protein